MEKYVEFMKLAIDPEFIIACDKIGTKFMEVLSSPEVKTIAVDGLEKIINIFKEKTLSTGTDEEKKNYEQIFNLFADAIKQVKERQKGNENWFERLRTDNIPSGHTINIDEMKQQENNIKMLNTLIRHDLSDHASSSSSVDPVKNLTERQTILEDKIDILTRRLDRQDRIEEVRRLEKELKHKKCDIEKIDYSFGRK